jgi:phage baseplate assembly protein W
MATVKTNIARQYRDLDLNFTIHPVKKDINKNIDEMAVINSVKNLILTNHYERPFQPDLGSNIQKLLFENMDNITAAAIQREIQQTIKNFEPRVNLTTVNVSPNFDNSAFRVGMEFYIINRTEPITIEFFLERVR